MNKQKSVWTVVILILVFFSLAAYAVHESAHDIDDQTPLTAPTVTFTTPVATSTEPVATSTVAQPVATTTCYIGGCSQEICSSSPSVASSCIYRNEYACYKTAKCEVQPTGECGWTPTPTLNSCLATASSTAAVSATSTPQ